MILGDCGVSAPVLQNNGSQNYQLYHSGTPDESISVRNIVNSSVQRAQEKGVTCVKVDFFYHVKVITSGEDQSSCIIMRCNPVWNTNETMQSRQMQKQWFNWVEVDWDDNNGNVYTVPATLDLSGQILYSDQSTDLLASVRSLRSTKSLKQHDCIFFSRGDFMNRDR